MAWEGLREPVQVVWRRAALPVTEVALAGDGADPVAGLLAAAGPRMDLGRAPLLRVLGRRSRDGAGGWRWCRCITWCWTIRPGGGAGGDRGAAGGHGGPLPEPLPFRDFVAQARLGCRGRSTSGSSRGCWGT